MNSKAKTTVGSLAYGSAVAIGCLVATVPAFAQVTPTAVPGQTRQDIDPAERTPAVQSRRIDAAALAAPVACPFRGKGTVTLTRIATDGATLVSRAEVEQATADLLGRELDTGVLCDARDRVAALYARRGEALAAVDLPEQRISGGVLTLRVTEGRVVSSRLENREALGPASMLAEAYLAPATNTGPTRWADVERAFLLARDIPGADVRFAMRRAEDGSANGLETLAVFGPRRKLDIGVGLQNLGSEELGRNSASLRLDANSFTRFGERTSLVLNSSFGGEQQVVQLMEELRVGAKGWVVAGDIAYGRSRPEGGLAPLEIEGRSRVSRLGARYPLVRSRAATVHVGARFEAIDQTNDLGFLRSFGFGDIPLFDEDLRVLSVEANGRWQSSAGLATNGGLEVRKGLDAFGASQAGDVLLSRAEGRPDFTSVRLNAGLRWSAVGGQRVAPYLMLNGAAQWANSPLPAYEEFQVGNYTIGRGYDPGAASGDRGVALQAEGGVDIAVGPRTVSVFGFTDAARVWNRDASSYDASARSAGLGARLHTRAGQFSLLWASPRTEAVPGTPTPEARVLVTFNHAFSIR